MSLTPWLIHTASVLLVATDIVARSWRLRMFTSALGRSLDARDAFAATVLGDAGCGLTPMRLGGEPARLALLLRAGIPVTTTALVIAVEMITSWPVVIMAAAVIAARFAPEWFTTVAPGLLAGLGRSWAWGAALVVVTLVIWWIARRVGRRPTGATGSSLRNAWLSIRGLPLRVIPAGAALAFVSLASRVLLLPLLIQLLPDPPAFGPAVLGSFALLYAQLALPTPSGLGVVDLGLLAGAAGPLGGGGAMLLLWWRFYANGIGIGLGTWMAIRLFGWDALRRAFLAFRTTPQ